jgi:hypothetical protein
MNARTLAIALPFLLLAMPAGAAEAPKAPALPEASIPFADHGGVYNWQGDGEKGLWVQSGHRQWYYGTFSSPCRGLDRTETIRFKFSPGGTMDRYTTIATRDSFGECWLSSFTKSEGPPKKSKPGKAVDGKATDGKASDDTPAAARP